MGPAAARGEGRRGAAGPGGAGPGREVAGTNGKWRAARPPPRGGLPRPGGGWARGRGQAGGFCLRSPPPPPSLPPPLLSRRFLCLPIVLRPNCLGLGSRLRAALPAPRRPAGRASRPRAPPRPPSVSGDRGVLRSGPKFHCKIGGSQLSASGWSGPAMKGGGGGERRGRDGGVVGPAPGRRDAAGRWRGLGRRGGGRGLLRIEGSKWKKRVRKSVPFR